jgi:hypothetical protein
LLANDVVQKLQQLTDRPFTCNLAFEAVAPAYVANCVPTVQIDSSTELTEHHAFICPAPHNMYEHIQLYKELKAESRHPVSACIMVLKSRQYLPTLLEGMQLLCTLPSATRLSAYSLGHDCDIQVFYDPPGVVGRLSNISDGGILKVAGHIRRRAATLLLDTGASNNFISQSFATQHRLQVCPDNALSSVIVGNGQHVAITGSTTVLVQIGLFKLDVKFFVMSSAPGFDAVLGLPWLEQHADLQLRRRQLVFYAPGQQVNVSLPRGTNHPKPAMQINGISVLTAMQAGQMLDKPASNTGFVVVVKQAAESSPPSNTFGTCGMPAHQNWVNDVVLNKYKHVFAEPTSLPPMREIARCIELQPGSRPPYRPQHRLSPAEKAELEKQVKILLAKGWIQPSVSPYGAPVLFVRKKDGTLRMCIDYRALNNLTIKNRYPLPRIDQLLDTLQGSTCFSSLDLHSGYHQIRLAASDVPKTAFSTPTGHYEYMVMPMGISNAPSVYQSVMHNLFRDMLGKYVLIYLDDILVYSKTPAEHRAHLEAVLLRLQEHDLKAKPSKCEFFMSDIKFLGHIVGSSGVQVDPSKIKVIKDWPVPATPTEVRSFLGLANYFRKFIQGFSKMAQPLNALTKSSSMGVWGVAEQSAFDSIKNALLSTPCLAMPDMDKDFVVIADASITGLGAVLLQDDRPVAFWSQLMSDAERKYGTTEQELLAVVRSLEQWRCYLLDKPFTVITDHSPNTFFHNKPHLTPRQVRWSQQLAEYNFTWVYKPGKINVADPLSRLIARKRYNVMLQMVRSLHAERAASLNAITRGAAARGTTVHTPPPAASANARRRRANARQRDAIPFRVVLDKQLHQASQDSGPQPMDVDNDDEAQQGEHDAGELEARLTQLESDIAHGYSQDSRFSNRRFTATLKFDRGLWFTADKRIYVPKVPELQHAILFEAHDAPYSGHLGVTKTMQAIRSRYYWQGMVDMITQYVVTCPSCQRVKAKPLKPAGFLQPLNAPYRPWSSVSVDFIVGLPKTAEGYDSIAVWVDRMTKMVHFVPRKSSDSVLHLVNMFMWTIFRPHGCPLEIVSDRDPLFTSSFWEEFMSALKTKLRRSTAYHAQTDGQTERLNRVLEEMLRHFIGPNMTDWDQHLPTLEFAYNSAYNEPTQSTPFHMNQGIAPLSPLSTISDREYRLPHVQELCRLIKFHLTKARLAMDTARLRAVRNYDKRHRDVEFAVNQMVLLSAANLQLKFVGPNKFRDRFVGPFKVIGRVGKVAYRLALPPTMRCHDVFHVSLLHPWRTALDSRGDDRFGRVIHPPAAVEVDGELEYHVEAILDHTKRWGRTYYLVKWLGFGAEHNSWEPDYFMEEVQALDVYLDKLKSRA